MRTTAGDAAAGRIVAFSHVNIVNRDMDRTVQFYRDVLGLKIVATTGKAAGLRRDALDAKDPRVSAAGRARRFERIYWFQPASGEGLGFYETPDSVDGRETLPVQPWWPGAESLSPKAPPHKLDYLALRVAGRDDVDWFMGHLAEHGVKFTGPFSPGDGSPPARYAYGLYFWDPDGVPMAIIAPEDAVESSLLDPDPVPALAT